MWRKFLLVLTVLAGLPAASSAAELTAADKADIARVEAYLNSITTVRARFLQQSSTGGSATGSFYMQRPGRLRIDYRAPPPLQIYASAGWLIYVDTELQESSYVPLSATPAGLLVRENVKLSGDVTVTKLVRAAQAVRIELMQTKEPDSGRVVLTFADGPLELRQWTVLDSQGISTTVALLDAQFGVALDPKLFVFIDPKFGQPPER